MASYRHSIIRFAGLLALGFFLSACSGGDDGRDVAAGPAGQAGPPGGKGPSRRTSVPID